ncbi:hypothetical protein ZWY2020_023265 [Hordeum vulgare]|nr:hypothetical protein ZWY2020_023265 [Hordeum vulgare]
MAAACPAAAACPFPPPRPAVDQLEDGVEALVRWTCSTCDLTAGLRSGATQSVSSGYTARSMRRGTSTAWWLLLLVAAAALLVLVLPVLASERRLRRPPPVLPRGGGGADAGLRGGRALAAVERDARRLGQRTPVMKPPSPKPHGMAAMAVPPPPSLTS